MKRKIIVLIIRFLIPKFTDERDWRCFIEELFPGYHITRNGGKKKIKPGDTVTMNTDGEIQ